MQNKSGKWSVAPPPPPPPPPRRSYKSLEREFMRNSDSFYILENISFSRLYERFSRNCQKIMFVLAHEHLLLDRTPSFGHQ